MRTSLNTFHKNNIHRALLLSCALTVLPNLAYGVQEIDITVNDGVTTTRTDTLTDISGEETTLGKYGAGTLILNPSTANTYVGYTTIYEGTLALGNNNALPTATFLHPYTGLSLYLSIQLKAGTTLRADGNITTPKGLALHGSATLDAQSYAFILNGYTYGNDPGYDLTLKGAGPITFGTTNFPVSWTTNQLTGTLYVGDGVSTTTLILSAPAAIGSAPIRAKTGTTLRFGAGTYSMTIASF